MRYIPKYMETGELFFVLLWLYHQFLLSSVLTDLRDSSVHIRRNLSYLKALIDNRQVGLQHVISWGNRLIIFCLPRRWSSKYNFIHSRVFPDGSFKSQHLSCLGIRQFISPPFSRPNYDHWFNKNTCVLGFHYKIISQGDIQRPI